MVLIARLYARRIVNINVNVILAGVLAMLLTLIPVHLSRHFTDHKPTIMAVTFVSDVIFDVIIYYVLHWLANHMPKRRQQRDTAIADLSFLKDASLVQFERALLAPIYYGCAMGLQWMLLHAQESGTVARLATSIFGKESNSRFVISRELATAIALIGGILVTRTLHTIWMIRQERRRQRAAELRARAGTEVAADRKLDPSEAPVSAIASTAVVKTPDQSEVGAR